jgi:cytochrome c553
MNTTDRRRRFTCRAARVALLAAALGVGGFLVAASGVVPIKASSKHWAITTWFLQFSKQRSVATHSLAIEAPPLEQPWLALKGAAHYEIGCRPCHGSPEMRRPRIAQAMTPTPPYLPETVSRWRDEELFYMVKHGTKFTGMPAWPSQKRDDEVWAMVAFLRDFPQIDREQYRSLVNGAAPASQEAVPLEGMLTDHDTPHALIANCARCHRVDGLGCSAAFPNLAGQRPSYITQSLKAYARGDRHSGIMEPIAAALSEADMHELGRYYGTLRAPGSSAALIGSTAEVTSDHGADNRRGVGAAADGTKREPTARTAVERGEAIARFGVPDSNVPACAACHGPSGTSRNPIYPTLAQQSADYIVLQLTLFKDQRRGGTAYAHLMRHAVAGLSTEQMRDVAQYYASLSSP